MEQAESRSIELTRERRSQYMEKLVKESPELFQALIKANLLPENILSAPIEEVQEKITSRDINEIESVLFRDPFTCSVCSKTTATGAPMTEEQLKIQAENQGSSSLPPSVASRVCPVNQQPHRRLLIEVALRFLNLVSEARASIVITKDPIPAIPTAGSLSNVSSPITESTTTAAATSKPAAAAEGHFPSPTSPTNATATGGGSGNERQKIRRALPRKPHLLVLAFHAASAKPDQQQQQKEDEMRSLAINLVVTMCNIYKTISEDRSTSPNFSRRLQRLLIVFDRTWRSYVQKSLQELAGSAPPPPSSSSEQQQPEDTKKDDKKDATASNQSTDATSNSTSTNITKVPPPSSSSASSGFSFKRALGGIASSSSETKNTTSSTSASANKNNSDGGSTSEPEPTITMMRPVAPFSSASGRGNSVSTDEESDSDRANNGSSSSSSSSASPFMTMMNAQGQQQQLSPEQQQQATLNLLLEQKRRGEEAAAREAFSARVRMRQQNAFADGNSRVQKVLDSVSEEVESKVFLEELQQRPPKMHRIPFLLRQITDSLIGVIPSQKLRQQLERELSDVLDWDVLKHADPDVVARVMKYVVGKVIELGAPAREADLRKDLDNLVNRLQTEDPSTVIVDSIRFLRSAVRTLGEDILKAQLALVRPELAKRALTLQRKYMDEWMSAPPQWIDSTKTWIRSHIINKLLSPSSVENDKNQEQEQKQQQLAALNWEQLKSAVADGVMELLRSSGRSAQQPRWGEYPTELFYFEKPVIFTTANQIQMLVVRLMITGTCRQILMKEYNSNLTSNNNNNNNNNKQKKIITNAQIQAFEAKLDKQLVEWLTGKERMSIAQLKDEVEGEIQYFVNSTVHQNQSQNEQQQQEQEQEEMLSQQNVAMLRGVMDQMVDTNSAVYSTFERKILKVISSLVRQELEKRSISRGSSVSEDLAHRQEHADELASLGRAVGGDVSNAVLDIVDMVEHHVHVYAMRYEFILQQGQKY